MNSRLACIRWGLVLAGPLLFATLVQAADIKVMCDSPLEPALTKVVDLYSQQTHNRVSLVFDPSPAVQKRIEDGEAADVVIVQPDFAEDLTKAGRVSAGDRPIIAHVGVGLGNRKDGPSYDISTAEKLKNTLLGADLLVFNSVKSGQAFANVLERLGIAERLKPKIVRTTPNGIFEPVLKGKGNDMVAGTIPLIATTGGIKLLGPLPGDLQSPLTYTAVLMANTSQRDTAMAFIKFLASRQAKEAFAANGAE
ncbi:substrate-binding domain-containing protein [Variovorax sp. Sphag1AA]|uniref:molybdate ABC transporter substrate-binding protein n=1 Tax=Variovorax sp. Sphag1AA TaxID=2587027 RepID=UPI001619E293|nr:substrate-binding domain-containing protein [Variovorax sp. Sphag1AA]MBB3181789.1 molybdate transport system substrate-binding protein [Variovorax sp. Sphag1AA]